MTDMLWTLSVVMRSSAGLLRNCGAIHSSSKRLIFSRNVSTDFEMHRATSSISAEGLSPQGEKYQGIKPTT